MRTQLIGEDEPLFAVRRNDKQCYIDRLGQLVLQTRFSWGQPFSADRAIVYDDKRRTFVIDREGRDVFESAWDDIQPFSEGLAAVKKDSKWGFVDREGRVVTEPQHDSVTAFAEGLAGFEVGRTGRTSRVRFLGPVPVSGDSSTVQAALLSQPSGPTCAAFEKVGPWCARVQR